MLQWSLVIALGAALLVGCLLPNRWLPASLPNDKLLHFAGFGLLGLLALPLAPNRLAGAGVLLVLLVLSWAIECLQDLVPDRAFSWRDLVANAAGLASAGLIALLYVSI
ncbi:MAG: VanZ family protein [Sphingomonadaceae bacterium]